MGVILFDGFCSVTPSYLANLLVNENFHPLILLAVLWSLMEIHVLVTKRRNSPYGPALPYH
jgi:tetrahydromethanopterin S-methyltransferase subunit E